MTEKIDAMAAYSESVALNEYYKDRNLRLANHIAIVNKDKAEVDEAIVVLEAERNQLLSDMRELTAEIEQLKKVKK